MVGLERKKHKTPYFWEEPSPKLHHARFDRPVGKMSVDILQRKYEAFRRGVRRAQRGYPCCSSVKVIKADKSERAGDDWKHLFADDNFTLPKIMNTKKLLASCSNFSKESLDESTQGRYPRRATRTVNRVADTDADAEADNSEPDGTSSSAPTAGSLPPRGKNNPTKQNRRLAGADTSGNVSATVVHQAGPEIDGQNSRSVVAEEDSVEPARDNRKRLKMTDENERPERQGGLFDAVKKKTKDMMTGFPLTRNAVQSLKRGFDAAGPSRKLSAEPDCVASMEDDHGVVADDERAVYRSQRSRQGELQVPCPLCSAFFPQSSVAAHASDCSVIPDSETSEMSAGDALEVHGGPLVLAKKGEQECAPADDFSHDEDAWLQTCRAAAELSSAKQPVSAKQLDALCDEAIKQSVQQNVWKDTSRRYPSRNAGLASNQSHLDSQLDRRVKPKVIENAAKRMKLRADSSRVTPSPKKRTQSKSACEKNQPGPVMKTAVPSKEREVHDQQWMSENEENDPDETLERVLKPYQKSKPKQKGMLVKSRVSDGNKAFRFEESQEEREDCERCFMCNNWFPTAEDVYKNHVDEEISRMNRNGFY